MSEEAVAPAEKKERDPMSDTKARLAAAILPEITGAFTENSVGMLDLECPFGTKTSYEIMPDRSDNTFDLTAYTGIDANEFIEGVATLDDAKVLVADRIAGKLLDAKAAIDAAAGRGIDLQAA